MKKVAIIGTAGVPARYGGFETLANQLVFYLGDKFQLSVYCSTRYYPRSERKAYHGKARLYYLPLHANGIQSILYDMFSIFHALFYAEVLVVLGVSGAMLLPLVRLLTRKKIIVSIDGLEWRRAKWGKGAKWFLKWSEQLAIRFAHADISDNEAIQNYTATRYGTLSTLIEYGGDHTLSIPTLTRDDYEEFPFLKEPYAFTVCRIEPENNLDMLLEAFRKLTAKRKNLVVVGNWNDSEYGRRLRALYGSRFYHNLHLLDPIYDQEKLDKLRANCQVYLHGHSAGGTNPSLVEAMALGLPIIAYDVAYNRATTENKALYFSDADSLTQLLINTDITCYRQLRPQMQQIAQMRYQWAIIAKKYEYLVYKLDKQTRSLKPGLSRLSPRELISRDLGQFVHPSLFYDKM
jgi:glycosyltransferase involved in cell wall biosynthesis